MALQLDLKKFAPEIEVDFGYRTAVAKANDEVNTNLASAVAKVNEMSKEMDGLEDKLANESEENIKAELTRVYSDIRSVVEKAIDDVFGEEGLGAELYEKVGKSTLALMQVFTQINDAVNAKVAEDRGQRANRYTRRNSKKKLAK